MNPIVVQCSSCRTEFELDPAKVPPEGVRARCTVCSAVISVPPHSVGASASGAEPKRPINPFLAKDPSLRAKRLARALVSDIVAYHPAKHMDGLRDGTLKTLFRDEIKKSYDEYVDQVGQSFAETTTHFQDALNDVLAAGKRLF